MASERAHRVAAVAALALCALFGWALYRAQAPPEGPVPVAWDRVACAQCRMLVGEPGFAAELDTPEGVLFFDDPGCLLLYVSERGPELRAAWFHHHDEERWISGEQVGFEPVARSPMGYGLAARDAAGAPVSRAEALERVLALASRRRQGSP